MYTRLTKDQTESYLARLAYDGPRRADFDVLARLMNRHSLSIPFENFDVCFLHREPELTVEALFDKFILRRRGGYCFELNGLFAKLLESLGFEIRRCAARIVHGDALPPPAHELLIVRLGEKDYFCDVGFGGPVPLAPIELRYDVPLECISGNRYRFEKRGRLTAVQILGQVGFSDFMLFDETPCDPVDFLPLNAFCAFSPKQPFIHRPMAWLRTPDGKISLDWNVLRIKKGPEMTERVLSSPEEISSAICEYFGISIDQM